MALQTFPTLAGIAWSVDRQEIWQTRLQASASGKETRAADWTAPRHQWDLSYEFLRQGIRAQVNYDEYAQLRGFFDQARGMFGTFIYQDGDDNSSTGQTFGIGDGTTVSFPLMKAFGGYVEPVYALTAAPTVTKTDWAGTIVQSATPRTNLIPFSTAISSSHWSYDGTTNISNSVTAPDGSNAASSFISVIPNSATQIRADLSVVVNGRSFRSSIYLKDLVHSSGVNSMELAFSTTVVSGGITNYSQTQTLANGWTRWECVVLFPFGCLNDTSWRHGFNVMSNNTGVVGGTCWGFQAEEIPNLASSSTNPAAASWIKTNANVTTGRTDPDGGSNAITLAGTAVNVTPSISQTVDLTGSPARNGVWYLSLTHKNGSNIASWSVTATLNGVAQTTAIIQTSGPTLGNSFTVVYARITFSRTPVAGDTVVVTVTLNPSAGTTVSADLYGIALYDTRPATTLIPTGATAGTVTDYTLTANTLGQNTVVTFASPPAAGATLTADVAYAYVCRFAEDNMTFSKFMSTLYEAEKVSILSMK